MSRFPVSGIGRVSSTRFAVTGTKSVLAVFETWTDQTLLDRALPVEMRALEAFVFPAEMEDVK